MTDNRIKKIAIAIANARGGRRGLPFVSNILDILPSNLLEEVEGDARAVIKVIDESNADLRSECESLRQQIKISASKLQNQEKAAKQVLKLALDGLDELKRRHGYHTQ